MTNYIDGAAVVCEDGVCRLVEGLQPVADAAADAASRIAHGYMDAGAFISFLNGGDAASGILQGVSPLSLLLVVLGGAALNLTPCVLPMIPVSLMVIGKSAKRGLLYGAGMMLAYGALGVLAAVGGMAFGAVQSSPLFNAVVSAAFVAFSLALLGVWNAGARTATPAWVKALKGPWFAFAAGAMSAVLAGACVAPVLASVLILTAKMYAGGSVAALLLPFLLGAGMALPWPFLGAGLLALPKPGAWMKWVNRAFAGVVLALAAKYGMIAWRGWFGAGDGVQADGAVAATPADFEKAFADAKATGRPVLVDCWATWCGNCAAMDKVLAEEDVKEALKRFAVIRLQAEDMKELVKLPGFGEVRGLPAFLVFEEGRED